MGRYRLRTEGLFRGASVTLCRILFSSFAPVSERFDACAKSVFGRTSLALPEGKATAHAACCKFSLPHPGESAGSPNPSHFSMVDRFYPARTQCSFADDRDRTNLRELRREGSPHPAWRLLYLWGHAAHGAFLVHILPRTHRQRRFVAGVIRRVEDKPASDAMRAIPSGIFSNSRGAVLSWQRGADTPSHALPRGPSLVQYPPRPRTERSSSLR